MMEIAKIAIKIGLIAVVTSAIIILFTTVQIPSVNTTVFTQSVSAGLGVIYHWIPITTVLFPFCLILLGLELAILGFKTASIAWKWLFKVNE